MTHRFSEVRLNPEVSLGAKSDSSWRTIVTTLEDGSEDRDRRWAHAQMRFAFGYDARRPEITAALAALHKACAGRHTGFRFQDHDDWNSARPGADITATDQVIGTGDGATTAFQLVKEYKVGFAAYNRPIYKPRPSLSPKVAVNGAEITEWSIDFTTGIVTFDVAPASGALVTAGFAFDVPVRFDSDTFSVSLLEPCVRGATDIVLVEDRKWESADGEEIFVFSDAWNPLDDLVNSTLPRLFA